MIMINLSKGGMEVVDRDLDRGKLMKEFVDEQGSLPQIWQPVPNYYTQNNTTYKQYNGMGNQGS